MPFPKRFFFWLILLFPIILAAQSEPFSADSAYGFVQYLANTIGPRPMGSGSEQRALKWAAYKFKSYSADTAYIMAVSKASNGINTSSGVAVGIFRGETDSTIVIGAHIDSEPRESPGASDDASGSACVIELARIWSEAPRHYTLLFATFGGEEGGLVGSKHFVNHYPEMEKVALMLNIDMAGSEGWLIPFIDTKTRQAPKWLVEDSYAIDRSLGYNSLEYPTQFFSINGPLGGAGSDQMSFMEKGIPAIDFTAGINIDPIHTPRDRIEFLSKPMLARSGRLVSGLMAKYQAQGIPSEREGHYMLWEIFGGQLFIPNWLILTADILALLLGIAALLQGRKHRLIIEKGQRARVSGLKLIAIMLIIAIFTQLGEAGLQLIKGLRYPWLAHVDKYLWFAAIWALAGVWVGGQLTRYWRFSPDPYTYAKRAIVLLIIFMIALGLASPRLALYPALTLLILVLVINVPGSLLKMAFTILAPIPMFRLMFMETLPFFARTSVLGGIFINDFFRAFLYSAALTLILLIWFLPAIFIFAYTISSVPASRKLAQLFRKPLAGILILIMVAAYGGYLYSFPAYNEKWRAKILVDAEYDQTKSESKLNLEGNEYFCGVTVAADTLERHYDQTISRDELPLKFKADWLKVSGEQVVSGGEMDTVSINWQLISERSWYRTSLKLSLDSLKFDSVESSLSYEKSEKEILFRWTADPPDTLRISAKLIIPPGRKLIRRVKGIYPEIPLPVTVTAEYADVEYRTTVTYLDTLKLAAANEDVTVSAE